MAPVLRRVTERRVSFLAEVYEQLGHPAADARRQALLAYAAYTGWLQLRSSAPDVLPELADTGPAGTAARGYLADRLIAR